MGPSTVGDAGARWQGRWAAGLTVRAVMTLVPFVLAVGTIAVGGKLVPRPDGALMAVWYLVLCAVSWAVLWQAQRILQRLLPLAALLEMSLLFPDRAPSRLRLARRVASKQDLQDLLGNRDGPGRPESTQEAAERILVLVSALAGHDRGTRGHSERVRAFADLIATRLNLPEHDRDRLRWAALLHDIGKLHVPSELLNKAGAPTEEEWQVLRKHPHYGELVAAPLLDWLGDWGDVIVQHHEKWDGSGYPAGLTGTQICLGARIVSVADAFDVMTAARAYKKPMGRAFALRELVACSGSHFDPDVVRALITTSSRRQLFTMGPLSWVSGLPLVGQAPAAIAGALTSQATAITAAIGAAALTGVTAISPVTVHSWPTSDDDSAGRSRSPVSRSSLRSGPGTPGRTGPGTAGNGVLGGDGTRLESGQSVGPSPTGAPSTDGGAPGNAGDPGHGAGPAASADDRASAGSENGTSHRATGAGTSRHAGPSDRPTPRATGRPATPRPRTSPPAPPGTGRPTGPRPSVPGRGPTSRPTTARPTTSTGGNGGGSGGNGPGTGPAPTSGGHGGTGNGGSGSGGGSGPGSSHGGGPVPGPGRPT